MSKKILRECQSCGKQFQTWPYMIATGWGKFCSVSCSKRLAFNEHWEVAPGITCIELNHGKFALVDTADLPKIQGFRWRAERYKLTYYADADSRSSPGMKTHLKMHRLILSTPDGLDVDHVNGNGLDNSSLFGQKNIKNTTRRRNAQNRHHTKTSRFPGVAWSKANSKWRAMIYYGKVRLLGYFDDEQKAADVYNSACVAIEAGTFEPKISRSAQAKTSTASET